MSDSNYVDLRRVLDAAYRQSAEGKGRERHANDLPFKEQPILTETRALGAGFPLGQARKKLLEAHGMLARGQFEAAERELLGAIVYTAAAIIHTQEQAGKARASTAGVTALENALAPVTPRPPIVPHNK